MSYYAHTKYTRPYSPCGRWGGGERCYCYYCRCITYARVAASVFDTIRAAGKNLHNHVSRAGMPMVTFLHNNRTTLDRCSVVVQSCGNRHVVAAAVVLNQNSTTRLMILHL